MAIYNPNSLIAARLIDRNQVPLDSDWFRSRIQRALQLRGLLFPDSTTYRLLHSESDGVPGVIVDRFNNVMSVQIAAAGMEARRDLLFDALMEVEGVEGVVERNDHQLRQLEGLPERVGLVRGVADVQQISDGVISYQIDPLGGQKTGAYLINARTELPCGGLWRLAECWTCFATMAALPFMQAMLARARLLPWIVQQSPCGRWKPTAR